MTPGIDVNSGHIFVNNSNFENQFGNIGGFLYLSTVSIGEIENSNFRYGRATQGGAIVVLLSDLYVKNCNFDHNSADEGGDILGISGGNIEINDSNFSNSYVESDGGIIY